MRPHEYQAAQIHFGPVRDILEKPFQSKEFILFEDGRNNQLASAQISKLMPVIGRF